VESDPVMFYAVIALKDISVGPSWTVRTPD